MRARAFSTLIFAVAGFACGLPLSGCLRAQTVVARGAGDGLSACGALLCRAGVPFSGSVVEVYDGGGVHTRESYSRGKKSGKSLEYYPSGKLRWQRDYKNGVKNGTHVGWWENGRKMFEYHFRRGDYEGLARDWYETGAPAREMRYVKGVESGLQRAWRENGTLYTNYEARDGRQYGVINARMCYSVKNGQGVYAAGR